MVIHKNRPSRNHGSDFCSDDSLGDRGSTELSHPALTFYRQKVSAGWTLNWDRLEGELIPPCARASLARRWVVATAISVRTLYTSADASRGQMRDRVMSVPNYLRQQLPAEPQQLALRQCHQGA